MGTTAQEHEQFLQSDRPHILMVTNHGVHEWQVTAGLPDTGGQNVYVNQLSGALAKLGFKVTTANRGGYPHPTDGSDRSGIRYRGDHERIVYLEDSVNEFVRKEDMFSQTEELAADLVRRLNEEGGRPPVLIVSHYWDGGQVAAIARRRLQADSIPHAWIPHSLGKLKKANTDPSRWDDLRIQERIEAETDLLRELDYVVHTSDAMQDSLETDYGYTGSIFLPPGVDTDRFEPEKARADERALDLLAERTGRSRHEVAEAPVITEISRTAPTKRKDLLIKAFAQVREEIPNALLAVTIDRTSESLYRELTGLVEELGLASSVAVLGSIWEYVPSLYGHSAVYCTPSIMEGFGMSIQEAAACRVPAVASSRVPFATEYLMGHNPTRERQSDGSTIRIGDGAVVVPPDAVHATAQALVRILRDNELRERMGARAYSITVPAFTWREAARAFLEKTRITIPATGE